MRTPKVHLGHNVFAEIDEAGRLVLATEDGGITASTTMLLEPEVYVALDAFMQRSTKPVNSSRLDAELAALKDVHMALLPLAPEGRVRILAATKILLGIT